MRIALVAPTYLGSRGGLERRVDYLARGLAARGADVEILTQGPIRWEEHSVIRGGVTLRRFPSVVGHLGFRVAPGLYEGLRAAAAHFDVVDVHTGHAPLAVAVARARFHRRVLSPYGAAHRLTSGAYAYLARSAIDSYARVICASTSERGVLSRRFPRAVERIRVMPPAVDHAAIESAPLFGSSPEVIVTVGPLERSNRIDRVIAAMAAVESPLRLLIIGEGPAREHLQAYAADLGLSGRVDFAGAIPERDLYRWLRTARAVVALAEEHSCGLEVLEALVAGTPVVASDIPIHRELAAQFAGPPMIFVPPAGSLLHVADAITAAAGRRAHVDRGGSPIRSWDTAVDEMWELYHGLVPEVRSAEVDRSAVVSLPADRALTPKHVVGG